MINQNVRPPLKKKWYKNGNTAYSKTIFCSGISVFEKRMNKKITNPPQDTKSPRAQIRSLAYFLMKYFLQVSNFVRELIFNQAWRMRMFRSWREDCTLKPCKKEILNSSDKCIKKESFKFLLFQKYRVLKGGMDSQEFCYLESFGFLKCLSCIVFLLMFFNFCITCVTCNFCFLSLLTVILICSQFRPLEVYDIWLYTSLVIIIYPLTSNPPIYCHLNELQL